MPRQHAWDDPRTIERCLDMLYGFRDEIIAITRNIIGFQRKQLHLMKRLEQLELDRQEEKINEGLYIEGARLIHADWTMYRTEIEDLLREAPRWEANMHDMLDLCESQGIPCHTPLYSRQTRTLIRLRSIMFSNSNKGCTPANDE